MAAIQLSLQHRPRGELGSALKALVDSGRVMLVAGFSVTAMRDAGTGLILTGETADGERELGPVDRIVVATGQRPEAPERGHAKV